MAFMVTAPPAPRGLSLSDLGLAAGSGEQRRPCPLCSPERRKAARKDLVANGTTGLWKCHHCGESGLLTDFWTNQPQRPAREWRRERLRQAFALTSKPDPAPDPDDAIWRQRLLQAADLAGTPGEAYLADRGIPRELAALCDVQFIADWYGRPGVLFPLRGAQGDIQAAGVRYIDGRTDPKTRTAGKLSLGVFATPSAFTSDPVIIVEGPADALSIATTGRAAIALHRTSAPAWLVRKLTRRRVLVALDADAAGDPAAEKLITELQSYGARATRLRPPAGKDWNDTLLTWGVARFTRWLGTACYRYEPRGDAVPNARCRLCREPSHRGGCVDALPRPGPYACPDLAYGRGCRPCETRITRGSLSQPISVPVGDWEATSSDPLDGWNPPPPPSSVVPPTAPAVCGRCRQAPYLEPFDICQACRADDLARAQNAARRLQEKDVACLPCEARITRGSLSQPLSTPVGDWESPPFDTLDAWSPSPPRLRAHDLAVALGYLEVGVGKATVGPGQDAWRGWLESAKPKPR
jgi:hypothetical protein